MVSPGFHSNEAEKGIERWQELHFATGNKYLLGGRMENMP